MIFSRSFLEGHNAAAIQIPIGLEEKHEGNVCLITKRAVYFEGPQGTQVCTTHICADVRPKLVRVPQLRYDDCPADLVSEMEEKRKELIECLAEVGQLSRVFS